MLLAGGKDKEMPRTKKDTAATPIAGEVEITENPKIPLEEEKVSTVQPEGNEGSAASQESSGQAPPAEKKKPLNKWRKSKPKKNMKTGGNNSKNKAKKKEKPQPPAEITREELVKGAFEAKSKDREKRIRTSTRPSVPKYQGKGVISTTNPTRKADTKKEFDIAREEALQDFRASLDPNARRKLTGTVVGSNTLIAPDGEPLVIALVLYKGVLVNIPADEFLVPYRDYKTGEIVEFDRHEMTPLRIKTHIRRRFGSEVDFRVTRILDGDEILGSRLLAMEEIKDRWWRRAKMKKEKDENGNYLPVLRKGVVCKARIVCVIDSGIYIELLGVESYLAAAEIGQTYINSVQNMYQPGQMIDVVIKEIKFFDDGEIAFKASNRLVNRNKQKEFFDRIKINDNFQGEVVMIKYDEKAKLTKFMVKVSEELQVFCSIGPNVIKFPKLHSIVEVRVTEKHEKALHLAGYIVHLLKY